MNMLLTDLNNLHFHVQVIKTDVQMKTHFM